MNGVDTFSKIKISSYSNYHIMQHIENTIAELFDLQKFAIKLGLDNITKLSNHFDNPHVSYPTIHIAGTNGKGSTAIILQQILMQHGLRVGLFTSPHLVHFNERIRVNNDLIDNQFIADFWSNIKDLVLQLKATFFDTTTCMAFEYFKQQKVDVAIFETGLGGRLDSTNIVNPELTIITPISFDHSKQLGTTLTQIASEKAGIIKNSNPVFISKQDREVTEYFQQNFKHHSIFFFEDVIHDLEIKTTENNTEFTYKDNLNNQILEDIKLNLPGAFQAENACMAYIAAYQYQKHTNGDFSIANFKTALECVNWPGRLQRIKDNPKIYVDVSHNLSGFEKTLDFIKSIFNKKNSQLLIGLLDDKDFQKIVPLTISVFSKFWITEPENHRKLSAQILKKEYTKYKITANIIKDIDNSFDSLIDQMNSETVLFIMGSHYLAGKIQSMKV